MPITASYSSASFTLNVTGTTAAEQMIIDRDAAGVLRINGGAIPVTGGPATVANTDLITAAGDAREARIRGPARTARGSRRAAA